MKNSLYDRLGLLSPEQRHQFAALFSPGTKKRAIVEFLLSLIQKQAPYSHRAGVCYIYQCSPHDVHYRKHYQSYIQLLKAIEHRLTQWEQAQRAGPEAGANEAPPIDKLLDETERMFYQARYWYHQGNSRQALAMLEKLLQRATDPDHATNELLLGAIYELYLMAFDACQSGLIRERPVFTEKGDFLARLLLRALWILTYENALRLRFRPEKQQLQAALQELERLQELPRLSAWRPVLEYFHRLLHSIIAFSRMDKETLAENSQMPLPQPQMLHPPFALSFLEVTEDATTLPNLLLERAQDALHNDSPVDAYELLHQAITFMPATGDVNLLLYAYGQLIRTAFIMLRFTELPQYIQQYRKLAQQHHHPFHQALADIYEVRYTLFQPEPELSFEEMHRRLQQMATLLEKNLQGQLNLLRIQAKLAFRFRQEALLEDTFQKIQYQRFRALPQQVIKQFIRLLFYAYQQQFYPQRRRTARLRRLWQEFRTIAPGEQQFKTFLIEWIQRFVPAEILSSSSRSHAK